MPLETTEQGAREWLRRAITVSLGLDEPVRPGAIDDCLAWIGRPGNHLVTIEDPRYPPLLREIADPPPALFARGRLELLQSESLAIVGSRNATPRGVEDARLFARELSCHGLCIVSGLARGIDAAAHAGGLEGPGSSIAVLGTGPERLYPAANAPLARELLAQGCIVTEFPVGTPPLPRNFPQRNRVISGIARGVLVVEAAPKSGSLVTAHIAAAQNREVFAIPGSIHATLSRGCHDLIREGAKLVASCGHVLEEVAAWRGLQHAPRAGAAATGPQDPFLDAMGFAPVTLDTVSGLSGLDAASSAARLVKLELAGLVRRLAGGLYQRSR